MFWKKAPPEREGLFFLSIFFITIFASFRFAGYNKTQSTNSDITRWTKYQCRVQSDRRRIFPFFILEFLAALYLLFSSVFLTTVLICQSLLSLFQLLQVFCAILP